MMKKADQKTDLGLAEAKARFLQKAADVAPLHPVREHPYLSMGIAFVAGYSVTSLGRRGNPLLIATISQVSGIVADILPFIISRARSSGG